MPAIAEPVIVQPTAPVKSADAVASAAAKAPAITPAALDRMPSKAPSSKTSESRKSLMANLNKKAGIAPEPEPTPAKPDSGTAATEPAPEAPLRPGQVDQPASTTGQPDPAPEATTTTPADKKGGKVSPWKLVDDYKARLTKAEKDLADTKAQIVPEQERKSFQARTESSEKRVKELEDEIRHVNYSKSAEFQEKYQKPYNKAWNRAMAEVSEITLTDPKTNEVRAVTAADILQLVNLPLGRAQDISDELFGKFSNTVMGHRKEIRTLFDAQNEALEEAKNNSGLREQQQKEQFERTISTIKEQVSKLWQESNQQAIADEQHGSFFKPREGDEEWNTRLEKGFALVYDAFSHNPMAPNLTAEQRADVVRKHSAVLNRAASWGALRFENNRLNSKIKELETALAGYKKSTPSAGGTTQPNGSVEPSSSIDRMQARLQKVARPI